MFVIRIGLSNQLLAIVAKTASYLMNHLPTKGNRDFAKPYELLYGEKPDLRYQRVFGCLAWMHIPEEILVKRLTSRLGDSRNQDGELTKICPDRKLDQRAIAQILCEFAH